MIQNGLLKTFYQLRLAKSPKLLDFKRILWVWIFGPKWKKSTIPAYGQNFRFGVKQFPMILWFQMIQNGLLKTFYQLRLAKQPKLLDFKRILWVWILGPKWKKSNHAGMVKIFRFRVKFFPMILWFQMIQHGLLKIFYMWSLGIKPKLLDLNRILWVWIFGPK